jgi:hypothetical protein
MSNFLGGIRMFKQFYKLFAVVLILVMVLPVQAAPTQAPAVPVTFSILHTNDFHGQLEAAGSNPGMARVAQVVNDVRTAVGAANVLLVDAGDEMQGSLLSNLQKGAPVIATYNAMGYNVATFGNHEFDWGQTAPRRPLTPTSPPTSSRKMPPTVLRLAGQNQTLPMLPIRSSRLAPPPIPSRWPSSA